MKTVPIRPPLVYAATVIGAFVLGPAAALLLSPTISPNATAVAALAPFLFASVMALGVFLWMGWGLMALLVGGVARMIRGRPPGPRPSAKTHQPVPSGTFWFVVLGAVVGTTLGALGLLLSDGPPMTSFTGWLALGLGYGILLRWLAVQGYLPFPDDD